MRLLIYGMQSSGATTFTLFLAQRPDCLALVDVLNNFAAPRVNTAMDMVVKVTMTTAYPLAVHVERFRPDKIVLFLRDPSVLSAVTQLGWPADESFYSYKRRHEEIMGAIWRHIPDIYEQMEPNFGNVQGHEVAESYRDKPCDST